MVAFFKALQKEKEGRISHTNYRSALKSYFTTALGMFTDDFHRLKVRKKERTEKEILDKDEYGRLWAVLPEKFKLLFDIMNGCGVRVQELLDLQVKDITFKGLTKGKVFVRKGKGGKPGPTTLTKAMAEKVHDYVKAKKLKDEDLLFTNKCGRPYKSGFSLNKTLKHYCGMANIDKKITTHTFRHMFGTETTARCGIVVAQKLMRHESSKTTDHYNHPSFEEI